MAFELDTDERQQMAIEQNDQFSDSSCSESDDNPSEVDLRDYLNQNPIDTNPIKSNIYNDYTHNQEHLAMARLWFAGLEKANQRAQHFKVVVSVGGDPAREWFQNVQMVYINPTLSDSDVKRNVHMASATFIEKRIEDVSRAELTKKN